MPLVVPSVYRHEQVSPATVWVVEHNLSGNGGTGIPVVDVYVSDGANTVKIIPARVEKINANKIEIEFSSPMAGTAVIIA